jgi:uncharacterized damage-inducible protein DinB
MEKNPKAVGEERNRLIDSLGGKGAHVDLESALAHFPPNLRGKKLEGAPHTAWQLLEHIRIAQADILDFCVNSQYKELHWPDDYWPKAEAPADDAAWEQSLAAFRRDRKALQALVADEGRDLHSAIPHGDGQTLIREALLVIDHNSYHLGQLVFLRQMLGSWPPGK